MVEYGSYNVIKVGFCGKIYGGLYFPGYTPSIHRNHFNMLAVEPYTVFTYEGFIERQAARYKSKYVRPEKDIREERRRLSKIFTIIESNELFLALNTPIYIQHQYNGYDLIISHSLRRQKHNHSDILRDFTPSLQHFEFDEIIPKEQAYMNIESYISDVLSREYKEIPKMSNADKISQHGFDKTSFRGN